MSVRFSVTVQNSSGDAQTGKNVDLYAHGGAKVGDFTDNGDGTYYYDVATSGKYDVYIGGVLQDEMTGIYIAADDLVADISDKADKVSSPTTGNFAGLDASGNLTDSGNSESDFLTASIINDLTTGGTADVLSAEMGKTLKTLIGAVDFSSNEFISGQSDISNALLALANKIYDLLYAGSGGTILTLYRKYSIGFSKSGATSSIGGNLNIPGGATPTTSFGFPILRSGSITGLALSWSAATITNGPYMTILVMRNGSGTLACGLQIEPADASNLKQSAVFSVGDYQVENGDFIYISVLHNGGDSITNLTANLEITLTGTDA